MSTINLGMDTVPSNSLQPSVPINSALADTDACLAATVTREFTTDANITLVRAEYLASVLIFTDSPSTLTTSRDVVFPAHFPHMHVKNSTAQTLVLKKLGQAGLSLAAGADFMVASGATDVIKTSLGGNPGTSPIGRHMVPVMAGAIAPSVSGGCSVLTSIASAANQPDIVTLDFDPTTQEYAQFSVPMPESWDEGTVTFAPVWSHASTTTNFGVVWSLQAVAVSNDDAIAVAFGTAQNSADTGGTTNDLYVGPESPAITVAGSPASGDTVFFRVSRVTGDASDTMAIDARLHGVRLYISTAASTD